MKALVSRCLTDARTGSAIVFTGVSSIGDTGERKDCMSEPAELKLVLVDDDSDRQDQATKS